ncbi:MAG: hypothetical protein ACE5JK_04760 [Candidatus Omnitrophota bacterium]
MKILATIFIISSVFTANECAKLEDLSRTPVYYDHKIYSEAEEMNREKKRYEEDRFLVSDLMESYIETSSRL